MEAHENCADCVESYHACRGWPENQPFACGDFYRLPEGPGTTGQEVPASRMNGRTEPRARREPTPDHQEPALASAPAPASEPTEPITPKRRPSPAATPGPDGERLCGCGKVLPKRRRCCDDCRRQRREQTLSGCRRRKRSRVASHAVSDVPATHAGRHATQARSRAHNYSGQRYPSPVFGRQTPTLEGEQE
jgi:hypothetical protein